MLRLTSVDLGATADIRNLPEVFDFAKDYLGLLKAAVIASGDCAGGHRRVRARAFGFAGAHGGAGKRDRNRFEREQYSKGLAACGVDDLLAALISVCMRATGQASSLTGPLQEPERRLVLARAILGEWLGGSGGGWQDSGGVWPGIKLIEACSRRKATQNWRKPRTIDAATPHSGRWRVAPGMRERLQESVVLVHGGMAQNVGRFWRW